MGFVTAFGGLFHEIMSRNRINISPIGFVTNQTELALVNLMELFNHSSVAITKRYLGLRQEEILETYDVLSF